MSKIDKPQLDRFRFDALAEPERKLWGLRQIAGALGVSVKKARRLATIEGVPIYRPVGSATYFAWRSELHAWLRGAWPHEGGKAGRL